MVYSNLAIFCTVTLKLLAYLPITILVSISSVIFGSILGFILTTIRIKKIYILHIFANVYIIMMRCTPPIVLLFLVYYGLPKVILNFFNIDLNDYYKGFFVIITFALLFSANISEVMRSAYLSVNQSQKEAAISVGMTEFQAFHRIMLPQAIAVAIPNFCNAIIILLKDGSLAYIIGLMDMLGAGDNLIARNYGNYAIQTYIALAIIYWILVIMLERIFAFLEKYFFKGRNNILSVAN